MSHSVGSQQSVVPSGLPMLPGNGFKDPTKIDFKKTDIFSKKIDVNRFYPKTQLSCTSWARHSHCDSADPPTDWLEVCCVFNRTGRGGVMCDVWCGGPQEGE